MENINKYNLSLINLSQVELPKPIENTRLDWVQFGERNEFPQYLIDLMNKSALHNAILVSKVEMIIGDGLYVEEGELPTPNPNESMNDLLRKITWDLELFGGFYLNVIWAKNRKSIAEIYHLDYSKIRSGKEVDNIVEEYYYSENWENTRKYTPVRFDSFKNDGSGDPNQILFVKPYVPGQKYYPLPSYKGAIVSIETDIEIANFHLAHIKNGMNPSMMITLTNGIPTSDERKVIEKQMKEKYVGSDNTGSFILSFVDNKENAPIITTITPSQLDKLFIQLQDTVLQDIISGHRVTNPLLVGIKTAGQLGGTSELINSYNIYNLTVIKPDQNIVLEAFNRIVKINKWNELFIKSVSPIFMYSEQTLLQILTTDELRANIGYETKTIN